MHDTRIPRQTRTSQPADTQAMAEELLTLDRQTRARTDRTTGALIVAARRAGLPDQRIGAILALTPEALHTLAAPASDPAS